MGGKGRYERKRETEGLGKGFGVTENGVKRKVIPGESELLLMEGNREWRERQRERDEWIKIERLEQAKSSDFTLGRSCPGSVTQQGL